MVELDKLVVDSMFALAFGRIVGMAFDMMVDMMADNMIALAFIIWQRFL